MMSEFEEFADALLDQISVEINEEKDIAMLASRISEDPEFAVKFETPEQTITSLVPELKQRVAEFTGISMQGDVRIEFPDLEELKKIKGRKVFSPLESRGFVDGLFDALARHDKHGIVSVIKDDMTKFLVYSTYAKAYISKISTTYGDYLDGTIYLNNFVLSRYPQIILYRQGRPYEARYEEVKSGYTGALKMTMLEEMIHSVQWSLYEENKGAVIEVNRINEELAKTILDMDDQTVARLSEYLQIPPVPDEFPVAKRANLFFMLNPDNFIVNVLGPDVMTFTKVEIDPGISQMVPSLLETYQRWLSPIQKHHAAFSVMEGMAEFCVQNILKDDRDFHKYLTMFMGTDVSSYAVRKHMGKDMVAAVFDRHGKDAFDTLLKDPPTTRELKEPHKYLSRIS